MNASPSNGPSGWPAWREKNWRFLSLTRNYERGNFAVYLSVSQEERGDSLGIDFESYKRLARTSLAIIQQERLTMGLYRVEGGAALDIFGQTNCLTILIDSAENEVSLLVCPMDAPFGNAVCLLSADNSEEASWRKLLRIAKREIQR